MQRLRAWALLLLLIAASAPPAAAQTDEVCFPETGQCLSGRFRQFWEQNGGLPVFGYPITPAQPEPNRDTGQVYLTQWFERNRFELHAENAPPYDVLLGRLGDDRLLQLGVDWRTVPRDAGGPMPGCLWFDQTGHNVCDQESGRGFMTYWRNHGLTDPRLDRFGRSLALFGLPLTAPRVETNQAGDRVLTQWFERARFEWHPDKPAEFRVLLGLLGNELRATGAGPNPSKAVTFARAGEDGALLRTIPRSSAPAPATAQELRATPSDVVAGFVEVGREVAVGRTRLRPATYQVMVRRATILFTAMSDGREFDPRLAAELRVMPREVNPPEAIMTSTGICYSWRFVQVCTRPSPLDMLREAERDTITATAETTVGTLVGSQVLASSDLIATDRSLPDVEGTVANARQEASLVAAPTTRRPPANPDQVPAGGALIGTLSVLLPVDVPNGAIQPGHYAVFLVRAQQRVQARLLAADGSAFDVPVDFRQVLGQPEGSSSATREAQVILYRLCFLDWCIPGLG